MIPYSFPIAESFDSIQGEGYFAGRRMYFIRLAGCPVGKYLSPQEILSKPDDHDSLALLRQYHPNHSVCSSIFGQRFLCDTNYHKVDKWDLEEMKRRIVEEAPGCRCVCLTGGEPFAHPILGLVDGLNSLVEVHVETSGCLPIPEGVYLSAWITCSPKEGFLPENYQRIHELKFLISAFQKKNPKQLAREIIAFCRKGKIHPSFPVSLQPVGGIKAGDGDSAKFALQVLHELPQDWVVSLRPQIHKYLDLR